MIFYILFSENWLVARSYVCACFHSFLVRITKNYYNSSIYRRSCFLSTSSRIAVAKQNYTQKKRKKKNCRSLFFFLCEQKFSIEKKKIEKKEEDGR